MDEHPQQDEELAHVQALHQQMRGHIRVKPRTTIPYQARPTPGPAHLPGQRRFGEHEVARIEVAVSEAARLRLNQTSSEGRKVPQALAEAFATIPEVKRVTIEVIKKREKFRLGPGEEAEDPDLLVITAEGYHPQWHHTWYVHARAFEALWEAAKLPPRLQHLANTPRVLAANFAEQLIGEYPHTGKGA